MQCPAFDCLFSESNIFVSIYNLVLGYVETETSLVANLVGVKCGSSDFGTLFLLLLRLSNLAKEWTNLSGWYRSVVFREGEELNLPQLCLDTRV